MSSTVCLPHKMGEKGRQWSLLSLCLPTIQMYHLCFCPQGHSEGIKAAREVVIYGTGEVSAFIIPLISNHFFFTLAFSFPLPFSPLPSTDQHEPPQKMSLLHSNPALYHIPQHFNVYAADS